MEPPSGINTDPIYLEPTYSPRTPSNLSPSTAFRFNAPLHDSDISFTCSYVRWDCQENTSKSDLHPIPKCRLAPRAGFHLSRRAYSSQKVREALQLVIGMIFMKQEKQYAAMIQNRPLGRDLGLLPVPMIYSCGNDQSCAAIGAGLERAGDILCNFGTALVVYALQDRACRAAKR